MITAADVVGYDGKLLTLRPDDDILREMLGKNVGRVEITLDDGRLISADQRRKIFAMIGDIAKWCGHDPEYLRQMFTWDFRGERDLPAFSLSQRDASAADMTTAREFIDYLIDFCLYHDVPTLKPMIDYADDVDKYLYRCLEHRRCAICGRRAETHHVDRIGMGRDRESVVHVGLMAVALCREHHDAAHRGELDFFELNHIYGIPLDEYLCKRLNLKQKETKK
ncbi:MAG: putative HNHc nuclease [Oscillospiraceae bacterium]|nr:putative HNHc nuclease [Oscillospiraceae bacterium]